MAGQMKKNAGFFMTIGMGIDLPTVWRFLSLVLGGLVALLVVKALVAALACRLFAGGRELAVETAFLLAPAGEFAFVVIATALAGEVLDPQSASVVAAIAGLSMLVTPLLARLGRTDEAGTAYDDAIGRCANLAERAHLIERRAQL